MVYVYLLECKDGTFYTGVAVDLQRRITQHEKGKGAKYTRGRGPFVLRYAEVQKDMSDALRRERAIKKLTRAQKERLIASICLL